MPNESLGSIMMTGNICPECGLFVADTDVHPIGPHVAQMTGQGVVQFLSPSEEARLLKEIRDLLKQLVTLAQGNKEQEQ